MFAGIRLSICTAWRDERAYNSRVTDIRYAIVCAVRESGESDRIITLFGPECGKSLALVKGARKSKSKLAGASRPFCEGKFYLERGRALPLLTGVEVIRAHKKVQAAAPTLALGSLILEILSRSHWPDDLWEQVFRLAVNSLCAMPESRESGALTKLGCVMWAKLLKLSGEYPDAAQCEKCGLPVYEGAAYFDRNIERINHEKCTPVNAEGEPAGLKTDSKVCGAIYRLYDLPLKKYVEDWERDADLKEVERLLWRKMESVIGEEMKSRKFLRDALGW